jgi:hypothetical protein
MNSRSHDHHLSTGRENPEKRQNAVKYTTGDTLAPKLTLATLHTTGFNIQQILHSAHTVCLCVLCGPQNKQRLFPYTALTDWFL